MMLPPDAHVTSAVLWLGVLIAAPIDALLVSILAWRIKVATFRRLKWPVVITMAIFFAALWAVLACNIFWESVYHYLFPAWSRWLLPLAYGIGFGCAGLVSWWVAVHLHGSAVLNFCVLVALWGMGGHAWGVHRGLVEKPPLLRGASPVATILFSGFEFFFYGAIILSVAALLSRAWEWFQLSRRSRTGAFS